MQSDRITAYFQQRKSSASAAERLAHLKESRRTEPSSASDPSDASLVPQLEGASALVAPLSPSASIVPESEGTFPSPRPLHTSSASTTTSVGLANAFREKELSGEEQPRPEQPPLPSRLHRTASASPVLLDAAPPDSAVASAAGASSLPVHSSPPSAARYASPSRIHYVVVHTSPSKRAKIGGDASVVVGSSSRSVASSPARSPSSAPRIAASSSVPGRSPSSMRTRAIEESLFLSSAADRMLFRMDDPSSSSSSSAASAAAAAAVAAAASASRAPSVLIGGVVDELSEDEVGGSHGRSHRGARNPEIESDDDMIAAAGASVFNDDDLGSDPMSLFVPPMTAAITVKPRPVPLSSADLLVRPPAGTIPQQLPTGAEASVASFASRARKLPESFLVLHRQFEVLESVVAVCKTKQQKVTMSRAKEGIERWSKKRFAEKQLAQIVHVYPEAFRVELGDNDEHVLIPPDDASITEDRVGVFLDKLHEFYKSHPSSDEIPEAVLPKRPEARRYRYEVFKEDMQARLPKIESPIIRRVLEAKFGASSSTSAAGAIRSRGSGSAVTMANVELSVGGADLTAPDAGVSSVASASAGADADAAASAAGAAGTGSLPPPKSSLAGVSASLLHKVRTKEVENQLREEAGWMERSMRQRDLRELVVLVDCIRAVMPLSRNSMMMDELMGKVAAGYKLATSGERIRHLFGMLLVEAADWCELKKLSKGNCFLVKRDADARVASIKAAILQRAADLDPMSNEKR